MKSRPEKWYFTARSHLSPTTVQLFSLFHPFCFPTFFIFNQQEYYLKFTFTDPLHASWHLYCDLHGNPELQILSKDGFSHLSNAWNLLLL